MPLKNWFSIHGRWSKSSLKHSMCFLGIFSEFKTEFFFFTKTIQVSRARHAGHCWRSKVELVSDVLLWSPTYGQAKAGRPARTYIQQLCEDTGCNPEDLPEAMNDREKWREMVKDIRAGGTTWWWWWWWKQNFIACRSSKVSSRPDCIFEIPQLWQSAFSRMYCNSCCSCWFEAEIIKIGLSPHKMNSNKILNFQEPMPILNAHTKKCLETYRMHLASPNLERMLSRISQTFPGYVHLILFKYSLNYSKKYHHVSRFWELL